MTVKEQIPEIRIEGFPMLVLGDLHVPAPGRPQPWRRFLTGTADLIKLLSAIRTDLGFLPAGVLCTGDFGSQCQWPLFCASFERVLAVSGNGDDSGLRRDLPQALALGIGASRILLTHGWGSPRYIIDRIVARWGWEWSGILFGHTHRPLASLFEKVLCMNPGSPTDIRIARHRTFALLGTPGSTILQDESSVLGRNTQNGIEFAVFRLGEK